MRVVARRLLPSTSIERMAARFSVLNLFILTIMPERSGNVKQISCHNGQLWTYIGQLRPDLS
jgi:hypothetical protein